MPRTFAALVFALSAGSAAGQDVAPTRPPIELRFGLAVARIDGTELVYDGAATISRLDWRSRAPVVTIETHMEVGGWTLAARGRAALGTGDGSMTDTDWNDAGFGTGFAPADWTDRSRHPDTRLDRYLHAEATLGRDLPVARDDIALNLHAGAQMTLVRWTAYGGGYVYSDETLRDTIGDFPAGAKGITYQQRLPAAFLGAVGRIDRGLWTLNGLARAGVTIEASDRDHHWLRDLRFDNAYGATPFVTLGLRAERRVGDLSILWVSAERSQTARRRGDVTLFQTADPELDAELYRDAGGFDFRATTLGAGLEIAF